MFLPDGSLIQWASLPNLFFAQSIKDSRCVVRTTYLKHNFKCRSFIGSRKIHNLTSLASDCQIIQTEISLLNEKWKPNEINVVCLLSNLNTAKIYSPSAILVHGRMQNLFLACRWSFSTCASLIFQQKISKNPKYLISLLFFSKAQTGIMWGFFQFGRYCIEIIF